MNLWFAIFWVDLISMHSNVYIQTPTFESLKLKAEKGLNVFFKMDCFQPAASFKLRGMSELVRHHISQGNKNFVASSGGNAGLALAYAGYKLGGKVKVIVPKTTSEFMIEKISQLNADVEVYGDVWDEAHEHALKVAKELNAIYVSPFDDPLLWKGHSTLIDECAEQIGKVDAVVLAVGGGGLLCGVLEGLKKHGWMDTKVITTETEGAASFAKSFAANEIVELDTINTIATSLGAKRITQAALDRSAEFNIQPLVMTDEKAIDATQLFMRDYNILVEAACGTALAVPYLFPEILSKDDKVLVIACGGANTLKPI